MAWLGCETDMFFSPHIKIGTFFFLFFSTKDLLADLLVKVVSAAALP